MLEFKHVKIPLVSAIVFSASTFGTIIMLHFQGGKSAVVENRFSVVLKRLSREWKSFL